MRPCAKGTAQLQLVVGNIHLPSPGSSIGTLLVLKPTLLLLVYLYTSCLLFCALPLGIEASPIRVPDLTRCGVATSESVSGPSVTLHFNCCLALPSGPILDFSFDNYKPLHKHIRRPAHTANEAYIAKYNRAYELMKALPESDPRSFKSQADIHCAFCNGAYMQAGARGNVPLQVHFSWHFLPWHRWYLYFHERILGSLIGDPSFSLLYWNWDDQINGGNVMPYMFTRNGTAIYDPKRNPEHLPPALARLSTTSNSTKESVIVNENLNTMYQSVVTASTAELFVGGAYRTGTDLTNSTLLNAPLAGTVESGVHNAMHFWTGDPRQQLLQNMGSLATASRDPIFYAHHSNVDRLWDVWRFKMPGGERKDHSDPDFLNTEFVFYNENAELVRVKVRDALDNTKLGVSYKSVKADGLWMNYSPPAVSSGSAVASALASRVPMVGASPTNGTIDLGTRLVGIVQRPSGEKPSKSKEVLVIQGVELMRDNFLSLLVFVNLPDAVATMSTSTAEYVGTFNIMPSSSQHRRLFTNVKFEIGDNLKRIGIQKEGQVVITLVVKGSNEKVTIQGMQIKYET